jgi:peptidase M23
MGVHFKENEEKITLGMIISGIMIIAILVTSLIVYLLNVNSTKNNGELASQEELKTSDAQSDDNEFESVSIDIGKSVNEAKNEIETNTENTSNSANNTVNTSKANISNTNSTSGLTSNSASEKNTTSTEKTSKSDENNNNTEKTQSNEDKEIKFTAPVNGEILREFAKDSLVYSNTLEEWITHTGVDIKADKTTVVKAAANGKVESIKNDPRYGLTVIVCHSGGYKTVYANLLTAEYVVEGEEIEAGQTIGTVGNSSSFEIADDYHLHFELIKDGEYLNPCTLMEF